MKSILLSALKPLVSIASGLGKRKKLSIFIYHRVHAETDFMNPDEVTAEKFLWQMELMAQHFNVLPLADAIDALKNDSLPPRAVCITFDDGYADNYLQALPILNKFSLPATFFIASGYLNGGRMWNDSVTEAVRVWPESVLDLTELELGKFDISSPSQKKQVAGEIVQKLKYLPPGQRQQHTDYFVKQSAALPDNLMLNTNQLKQLHAAGMEVGGHTVSHPIIANIDNVQLKQELIENKQVLESILNTTLRFFAYPNGKPGQDYLSGQIDMIKQCGYQAALTTQWGVAQQQSDLWQLPRYTPWDNDPAKFMMRMAHIYKQPF
ncbi:MAG: polysaccharide deacetylase family protein [Methylococcales bacterium]